MAGGGGERARSCWRGLLEGLEVETAWRLEEELEEELVEVVEGGSSLIIWSAMVRRIILLRN